MELVNLLEIKSRNGYRHFKLMLGDVSRIDFPVDILCLSAFKDSYIPTRGTAIKALYDNRGINLEELAEFPELDERNTESAFITKRIDDDRISRILCLEMIGSRHRSLEQNLNSLLVMLFKAELAGINTRRVAMILFGTGSQGLNPADIMPVLIKKIGYLLETSHSTDEIFLIVNDRDKATLLGESMNRLLGRTTSLFKKLDIMGNVVRNIQALYKDNNEFVSDSSIADVVNEISRPDTIDATKLSILSRNMCEFMLNDLYPMVRLLELARKIKEAENAKFLPPWISTHFHLLRVFGNSHVHDELKKQLVVHMSDSDLIIVLFGLERVLGFYVDQKKERLTRKK
jgi:hypothetical protein